MTPQSLINECRLSGVLIHLDGGNLKLKGTPEAVRVAADRLRPFKTEIVRYQMELLAAPITDQVREFMEDGLTLAEAQAMAAVSVPVFSPGEWLSMIAELDDMIGIYCAAAGLTGEAKAAILSARAGQSLASIPETLIWFHTEVAGMRTGHDCNGWQ